MLTMVPMMPPVVSTSRRSADPQHLRLLLLLLLHGHEDQEIENRDDEDQRQKTDHRVGGRLQQG